MSETHSVPGDSQKTVSPGRMDLSRRNFLQMAGLAAAGAALPGCVPFAPVQPPESERVQLVYQDWRTDWFPPMAQQMLEQFHAEHPNIRVFYTPDPENLPEKMMADLQAGTAPDVFQGCCDFFPVWAQQGYTLDLRSYVETDLDQETIGDWDPVQYQALSLKNGHQFGLPKYHGALALYYNRDLFDQYGVAYPDETWDHHDYLVAMRQLTHDQNGADGTDLWGSMLDLAWERVQVHVNGWGGHLVDPEDPAHCRMAEPEALAALEWLRARMWEDRVMATPLDVQNLETRRAFSTGRVAMVEDGSWALKDILATAPFRVGVAPFPAGPARRVTLATTDGFGIYAGTRYPEAAWELVKFLVSKDYGRAMARANFLQPARISLIDEWAAFIREEFPDKAAQVDIAAFAAGQQEGYSVTAEVFTNMAEAMQLTYAAWEQIFTLGRAPVTSVRETCRQIEAAQLEAR